MTARPEDRARSRAVGALAIACLGPVVAVVSAFGARLGWWSSDFAIEVLTRQVAFVLAVIAPVVILACLVWTRRHLRTSAKYLALAAGVSLAFLAGQLILGRSLDTPAALDVTTDPGQPPALGLQDGTPQTCDGLTPVASQLAPETVTSALQSAGFTPTRTSLFQVEATREGFWFARRYDAVVRIRPGRTDFRLATEGDRPDGGAVCRLALDVGRALQAGR